MPPDTPKGITRQDIIAARQRLADELAPTPCTFANDLSDTLGQPVYLKLENLQRTGSFKARGALNWVLTAQESELQNGLITVSAGNHAMALAWAAQRRNVPVTVVMPEGSSALKIATTRDFGARVIVQGNIHEAVQLTHQLRADNGLTLVHPYNDARVMAGQGTVGLELLEQLKPLQHLPSTSRVLVPVGGGGLISGLGMAIKSVRPDLRVIGVEPEGAATLRNAWNKNDASAALVSVNTMAASLAPAVVGELTFAISRQVVADIITVRESAIAQATRMLMLRARTYAETGAAVGLAALLEERVPRSASLATACVVTGGNMDAAQARNLLGEAGNPASNLG